MPMNDRVRELIAIAVLGASAQAGADVDAALNGLSAGGEQAAPVFFSPAAITRLDGSEFALHTAFVYQDSKLRHLQHPLNLLQQYR